jgi:outer membrane protein
LLAERAGLKATKEYIAQARAGWQPTLTVNGSYGYQEFESRVPGFPVEKDETDPITGSVVLNQPVFRGGQSYYGSKGAKARVRAGQAGLISVEQQVLLDAVTAYVDVRRDLQVVDIGRNNVSVLKKQLQASQDRFQVGEVTRTDVAQSEARLSRSQANLIASEGALTASRSAYERVIGHTPSQLEDLPGLPALPATDEEALAIALARNPQLIAAREIESASLSTVRQTQGAMLPEISVQGVASHSEDTNIEGARLDGVSVTGNVRIPLYQGGAAVSRMRQAKQTNNQNRIQIAEAERFVIEGVANAWDRLRTTRSIILASQEQVNANEIAFEGVEQEAQVGSRTTLDVLNAEQELLDSRVALARAQRDEYVAAYALLSVIGQLTAGDLGL